MKIARCLGAAALVASLFIATTEDVSAKKAAATPAPSAASSALAVPSGAPAPSGPGAPAPAGSGSPVPLPTASAEPPSSAIPRLEAKVKANPNDRDALGELANYYLQVGRPDLAVQATQRLIALGSKTTQVYYLDGISNRELGQTQKAIDDFEQAANLEPTNSDILGTLTTLYLDANRPADAERTARRATTFNPTDKKAFEIYGQVFDAEKKYDDARAQYAAAAKLDPKDAGPLVLEAQSYLREGSPSLASNLFDQALAIDPKYPDALLGKARLLASEHDVPGAMALYGQLLPLIPDDPGKAALLIEEARVYAQEKMIPQAQATLDKAVAAYPKVPAVYDAYGDFDIGQRNLAGSEREWTMALGADPNDVGALQRLGDLYMTQQKFDKAQGEFTKLTSLQPNSAAAWAELGQSLAVRHQYQASRDAYRRSFELDHTPAALAGLGASDFEMHDYKECAQVFDAIDRGAPEYIKTNPQLFLVMANCYKSTQQRDKAKSAYVRLLALVKPGSPAHAEIQKLIAGVSSAPRPAASSKPKPKTAATSAPKH